jgi:thiol-disulfide isomerase/thioredoxin
MKTLEDMKINDKVEFRRRILLTSVALAAGLSGAGWAWWRSMPQSELQSDAQAFWDMRFEKPEGGELSLQTFKGRPLLVNFWATWCPPCIEELPLLESIWIKNGPKTLQVLGLAVDQPSAVRKFLARHPLTFPMGLAGLNGTELGRSLGNSMNALPYSVLFNADGRMIAQKMGKLEAVDLAEWLKDLKK